MNVKLPEKFDPYDMRLKRQFNANADSLNVIAKVRTQYGLCCGARHGDKICRNPAGKGTPHYGYGRCKIHGGLSTGPKTEEGKRKASLNNIKHGLYMKTLLPGEEAIFEKLNTTDDPKSLAYEINVLKTKIISYLMRNADKYAVAADKGGEEAGYKALKVWVSTGEDGARHTYHAATIEDQALDRALNTLRRLVETHNRLSDADDSNDIMTTLNSELKAASEGRVAISWSGKAQNTAENGKTVV